MPMVQLLDMTNPHKHTITEISGYLGLGFRVHGSTTQYHHHVPVLIPSPPPLFQDSQSLASVLLTTRECFQHG